MFLSGEKQKYDSMSVLWCLHVGKNMQWQTGVNLWVYLGISITSLRRGKKSCWPEVNYIHFFFHFAAIGIKACTKLEMCKKRHGRPKIESVAMQWWVREQRQQHTYVLTFQTLFEREHLYHHHSATKIGHSAIFHAISLNWGSMHTTNRVWLPASDLLVVPCEVTDDGKTASRQNGWA